MFAVNFGAIGFLAGTSHGTSRTACAERGGRGVRRDAAPGARKGCRAGETRSPSTTSPSTVVPAGAWRSSPTRSRASSWARCGATASSCPPRGLHGGEPGERRTGSRLGSGGIRRLVLAPHTLTARALVVAPDDVFQVTNRSPQEELDVTQPTAARPRGWHPGRRSRYTSSTDGPCWRRRAARPLPSAPRQVRPSLLLERVTTGSLRRVGAGRPGTCSSSCGSRICS